MSKKETTKAAKPMFKTIAQEREELQQQVLKAAEAMKKDLKVEDGSIYASREAVYNKYMPADVTPDMADKVHQYDSFIMAATGMVTGQLGHESDGDNCSATFEMGQGTIDHLYQRTVEINGEEKTNYLTSSILLDHGGEESAIAYVQSQIAELAAE